MGLNSCISEGAVHPRDGKQGGNAICYKSLSLAPAAVRQQGPEVKGDRRDK
jgi:hypothetical protein